MVSFGSASTGYSLMAIGYFMLDNVTVMDLLLLALQFSPTFSPWTSLLANTANGHFSHLHAIKCSC